MGKTVGIPWGSVVTLKSGGAPMLVTEMVRPGAPVVVCEWRKPDGSTTLTVLPVECLEVKKLPNRRMPHERNRT